MANIYVNHFRDVLKKYYEKQKEYISETNRNYEKFSPEFAEEENAKVRARQEQAFADARQSIDNIFTEVRGLLARGSFLNVEALSADRMLFAEDSGFDLTPQDVAQFVERYNGNFTMLRLIADWIAKREAIEPGKFTDIKIYLPADQLAVYRAFAESALNVIDHIYTNGGNKSEVDYYGDETFAKDLYSQIGTGNRLSDYKSHRIPDSAQHVFDNVTLSIQNSNVYVAN